MKRIIRPLALRKETIRALDTTTLQNVQGQGTTTLQAVTVKPTCIPGVCQSWHTEEC